MRGWEFDSEQAPTSHHRKRLAGKIPPGHRVSDKQGLREDTAFLMESIMLLDSASCLPAVRVISEGVGSTRICDDVNASGV